jgi:fumarylpyruvate hydrolase
MLPVTGRAERFPVYRIFCVGQNYAEHVRELGQDPNEVPPIFFSKPSVCVQPEGAQIPYPLATKNLHYEVELVVALGTAGTHIAEADALEHVYGYAVGIDLTRRDLQHLAKTNGQPWDVAKGFDASAPCSAIHEAASTRHPTQGKIWLSVNGEVRQNGNLSNMIWKVPQIIATLSQQFHLRAGDLIFTGTPAGVGPLEVGDRIDAGIEGVGTLHCEIV